MDTPIYDFLCQYRSQNMARFHMPGHKGIPMLGCEALDITEIAGADALYEAEGIIGKTEANTGALFGSAQSFLSTEGSSQCIRAMLHLAAQNRGNNNRPLFVAARNAHKSFLYGAALLDAEVLWLWPKKNNSLCSCPCDPQQLEKLLASLDAPPCAVYITSPDYLGQMADIAALAKICHQYGILLAVDNAHGAYLHFLSAPLHPLDLGADICCDSAHKTLPVLTGGAYLHIGKSAPSAIKERAKEALALFGSTSPSYLTMASLDLCNKALSEELPAQIQKTAALLEKLKNQLTTQGWQVEKSDPLRLTLAATAQESGHALAEKLRQGAVESEYADPDHVVLMASAANKETDLHRIIAALGKNTAPPGLSPQLPHIHTQQVISIREALFAPSVSCPIQDAIGRICAAPAVSCPPAIPVAISGERITEAAVQVMEYYGMKRVNILQNIY